MRCPYCAERIKAQAIRCKHCHRDLPKRDDVVGRLADLRSALVALEKSIALIPSPEAVAADLHQAGAPDQEGSADRPGWPLILLIAVAVSLISAGAMLAYNAVPSSSSLEPLLVGLTLGVAPLAALILGIYHPAPRWPPMAVIGVVSALGFLTAASPWSLASPSDILLMLYVFVSAFVVACVMVGAFGGWIGDRFLRRDPVTLPTRVRKFLVKGHRPPKDGLLERVADLAIAITPLVVALVPLAILVLQFLQNRGEQP